MFKTKYQTQMNDEKNDEKENTTNVPTKWRMWLLPFPFEFIK